MDKIADGSLVFITEDDWDSYKTLETVDGWPVMDAGPNEDALGYYFYAVGDKTTVGISISLSVINKLQSEVLKRWGS